MVSTAGGSGRGQWQPHKGVEIVTEEENHGSNP